MKERKQSLNERQKECGSTCLGSCRNVAYPSLEMMEELGEFVEKLLKNIEWNDDFKEKNYLESLMKGMVHNAYCIGRIAKQVRHQTMPVPFDIRKQAQHETVLEYAEMKENIILEVGDIMWGANVFSGFMGYTAQEVADLNCLKLSSRFKANTIDGQGDKERTAIEP